MRSLRAVVRAAVAAALAAFAVSAQDAPTPQAAAGEATISYLTGSSAYITAGSEEGLAVGDRVEVVRDGTVVAVLQVTFLSSHKASCAIPEGAPQLAVSDQVRYRPGEPAKAATPEAPVTETARATDRRPARHREGGLRGRVGLHFLSVRDRTEDGSDFTQPGLDLRLDGRDVGGAPVDLAVDVRARRTYRGGPTEDEDLTRVYRMAAGWHDPRRRYAITAGRQFAPALATVSVFDGVLLESRGSRWGAGVFSGTQPDAEDYGFSSSIREHGAYVEARGRPGNPGRWSITLGAVGSYDEGEINREFLYLQSYYTNRRFSGYLAQEVDYNRDWKAEVETSTFSPTSTFGYVRVRAASVLDLTAGYDNRRNVRLYRDRVTPETEFDDEFRRGAWAGVSLRLGGHVRADLETKQNAGGDRGDANSHSLGLRVFSLTRLDLELRARSTLYDNEIIDGQLHALGVGLSIGSRYHVDLSGGLRSETGVTSPAFDNDLTWIALDQDVSLGRHWYLLLSLERADGDLEKTDQAYASLSYRF